MAVAGKITIYFDLSGTTNAGSLVCNLALVGVTTRLVSAHIPPSEDGRVLGHTQANTTYRYFIASIETARRAAAALDGFNAAETLQP